MTTISAIAPWYGSKRTLAPTIVSCLDAHHSYWEPFCGSCAVLFAKPRCRCEVLNDLHENLTNLIRVVQHDKLSLDLFEKLERTAFCEDLYEAACEAILLNKNRPTITSVPDLHLAYAYFIVSWMGRNGLAGTQNEGSTGFCVRYTSSGGDPAVRFRNAVASIPSWWQRLQNVTVLGRNGVELCEDIEDRDGCCIYADPPYLSKQAKYAVDFGFADSSNQHEALAEVLRRFKQTRVLVSYYDDPLLEDLYLRHGWFKKDAKVTKNLAVRGGRQVAPEVLLSNLPFVV